MFINIFLEIDENNQPIYKEEFEKRVNDNNIIIAAIEYTQNKNCTENIWLLPEEITDELSKATELRADRDISLVISRNDMLENWMRDKIETSGINIEGILSYNNYISVLQVAKMMRIPYYTVSNERGQSQHGESMDRLRMVMIQMRNELEEKSNLLEETQMAKKNLEDYIHSTENYMRELQIHATNLDNQLQEYKATDLAGAIERAERLEKEMHNYLNMYKEAIREVDTLKTENLSMRQKYMAKK